MTKYSVIIKIFFKNYDPVFMKFGLATKFDAEMTNPFRNYGESWYLE